MENFAHTLKEWIGNNLSPIVGALFQANQLHIKYESGVGRNDARVPLASISKVRSASQLGTLPNTHLLQRGKGHFEKLGIVWNNKRILKKWHVLVIIIDSLCALFFWRSKRENLPIRQRPTLWTDSTEHLNMGQVDLYSKSRPFFPRGLQEERAFTWATPSSQPRITSCLPILNLNGFPLSREESNLRPSVREPERNRIFFFYNTYESCEENNR